MIYLPHNETFLHIVALQAKLNIYEKILVAINPDLIEFLHL